MLPKRLIWLALVMTALLALTACDGGGGGGSFFCYEFEDLDGRWRRDADADRTSAIRFDGQGYIVEADPPFADWVGRRAQVDCDGKIHGDLDGQFQSQEVIVLEGLLWVRI